MRATSWVEMRSAQARRARNLSAREFIDAERLDSIFVVGQLMSEQNKFASGNLPAGKKAQKPKRIPEKK